MSQFDEMLATQRQDVIRQHRDLLYEEECKQRFIRLIAEHLQKETAFELGERLKEFYPTFLHGWYPERNREKR